MVCIGPNERHWHGAGSDSVHGPYRDVDRQDHVGRKRSRKPVYPQGLNVALSARANVRCCRGGADLPVRSHSIVVIMRNQRMNEGASSR